MVTLGMVTSIATLGGLLPTSQGGQAAPPQGAVHSSSALTASVAVGSEKHSTPPNAAAPSFSAAPSQNASAVSQGS